jgi:diguanylate cyclase (GGDEF)-like protein
MDRRKQLGRYAWIGAAGIGALLIAVFLALPQGSVEQSAVYDVCGLAMVGLCIVGIRVNRPSGWLPWLVLAGGQLAFVIGDVIWTAYQANGEDPFPSIADASYLVGYPILALGLGIAIRRRVSGGDRAGLLDGAILACGAAVVWWSFVLGPLVATSDPDPMSFAIAVAYPMGDLLLIGLALGLLMTPGAKSISFALLVANLTIVLAGDLAYNLQSLDGTYVDGGLLDSAWLIAYTTFAMSALHPSMAEVFDPRPLDITLLGPIRYLLLGAAMLVGPALLVIQEESAGGLTWVVALGTAVLSVLVLTRLAGVVGHLDRDIRRRAILEEQLSYQAFHDPLTGLANRRRFIEAVREAIAAGTGGAVLFLDLDDFKDVNDGMGHDAGDALLTAVGHRILASIRPDDLGCRIGGDEFAILLPGAGADEAEGAAGRILAAIYEPVTIENRHLVVPVSIGVALARPGEAMAVDELLRRADVAMYHAKAEGKHRQASYAAALDTTPGASLLPHHERHVRLTQGGTPASPSAAAP